MAQMLKNLPSIQETRFNPLVGKILWRREWLPTPVFLPGKSHGQRNLTVHRVARVGHDIATKPP